MHRRIPEWDGQNIRWKLDADADEARADVAAICADLEPSFELWDAWDWQLAGETRESVAASPGITSRTTNEQLEAIVENEECVAISMGAVVLRTEAFLVELRDELVAKANGSNEDV